MQQVWTGIQATWTYVQMNPEIVPFVGNFIGAFFKTPPEGTGHPPADAGAILGELVDTLREELQKP